MDSECSARGATADACYGRSQIGEGFRPEVLAAWSFRVSGDR